MWAEKLPEDSNDEQPTEISLPLRSLPVKVPINISRPVAPYEDVKELIKKQDRIALTKCFCAVQQQLLGSSCNQPLEVCMMLGFYAEYYIEQGMGRKISQEEALDVLARAEEAGLVHQIPDTQDPGAICNCCPDCCGELRVVKMLPNPAALITCSYFCRVDPDSCNGCEICLDRCSMGAISITEDQVASINLDKCIGCGLCINTCPEEALTLVVKAGGGTSRATVYQPVHEILAGYRERYLITNHCGEVGARRCQRAPARCPSKARAFRVGPPWGSFAMAAGESQRWDARSLRRTRPLAGPQRKT